MTKRVHIAPGLSLPLDLVTESFAIVAKRRVGKSFTLRRIAEQLFKAGQQIVISDPKGDQWGIRSAADGKAPGLSILILGGEHGDVPLEVGSGELVAKLVVEERLSVVLDLSLFRKHEVATFMTAFAENLYRLKAREEFRTPVMVLLDEADAVAPQHPQKGEERMLGAIDDLMRRGGQRGIGVGVVTQRTAVLNKNVLTQAQILVALRTIAPQDLSAMKAWIDVHGTPEQRSVLMESLPSLPKGDAWFWSPGWPTDEGIFQRVHVLPIETFDSMATPKAGEKRVEPKKRADVDVEVLRKQMAATVERAKAENPRELQKRIRELEAELKKARAAKEPKAKVETREVYVLKEGQLKRLEALAARAEQAAEKAGRISADCLAASRNVSEAIGRVTQPGLHAVPAPAPQFRTQSPPAPKAFTPPAAPAKPQRAHFDEAPADGEIKLKGAMRDMLRAVASIARPLSRQEVGVQARISYTTGTFSDYISALRRGGYIVDVDRDHVALGPTGAPAELGPFALRSSSQLRQAWAPKLKGGARRMFEVLVDAGKDTYLTRQQLGEAVGLGHETGTFSDYLSLLRRNGLIYEPARGMVAPAEELFIGDAEAES